MSKSLRTEAVAGITTFFTMAYIVVLNTIVLIPLTFSITQGILWGFITHVLLYWMAGRRREIAPTMHGLALVSVALLVIDNL